jgi:hypothetical protein
MIAVSEFDYRSQTMAIHSLKLNNGVLFPAVGLGLVDEV